MGLLDKLRFWSDESTVETGVSFTDEETHTEELSDVKYQCEQCGHEATASQLPEETTDDGKQLVCFECGSDEIYMDTDDREEEEF